MRLWQMMFKMSERTLISLMKESVKMNIKSITSIMIYRKLNKMLKKLSKICKISNTDYLRLNTPLKTLML